MMRDVAHAKLMVIYFRGHDQRPHTNWFVSFLRAPASVGVARTTGTVSRSPAIYGWEHVSSECVLLPIRAALGRLESATKSGEIPDGSPAMNGWATEKTLRFFPPIDSMSHQSVRGLFITGTDTGVGKTYVTALIARALVSAGKRVGIYKPVASGCELADGSLVERRRGEPLAGSRPARNPGAGLPATVSLRWLRIWLPGPKADRSTLPCSARAWTCGWPAATSSWWKALAG